MAFYSTMFNTSEDTPSIEVRNYQGKPYSGTVYPLGADVFASEIGIEGQMVSGEIIVPKDVWRNLPLVKAPIIK